MAVAAASFLVQVLELGDDPTTIAPLLTTLKEARNSAIYSVELDSSIGTAAFLVYVYALHETSDEGMSGADLYQQGITTLRQAADRDTPGPRMVAHADSDAAGFILATTPATWRALQGEEQPPIVATEADLPATEMSTEQRAAVAEDLHRTLKEASDHAKQWLAALRSAGASTNEDEVAFTEEETALALFVLDTANIQPMLTALNALVASAQERAGQVVTRQQTESPEL
jgi:hypothetical protein